MKRITVKFGVSDELYNEIVQQADRMEKTPEELFALLMQVGSEPLAKERLALIRHIHSRQKGERK